MLKFSVIIPIYNVEEYLPRCIESVINQTYENIEIILVDDGSSDSCPRIADDYASSDKRIKVIHKPNGGLADARNRGLEDATGDYVIFLDSDDYIEEDTCSRFLLHTQSESDMIIGEAFVEGAALKLEHIVTDDVITGKEYLQKSLRAGNFTPIVWMNIYKLSFLREHSLLFKKGILYEDEEFTPRCFLLARSVFCTGIRFYHYCIRPDSITTRSDQRKGAEDFYSTCLSLERIYRTLEKPLMNLLLAFTDSEYLGFYARRGIIRYGRTYVHKAFALRNAKSPKTLVQALLYALSPRFYCFIFDLYQKKFPGKRETSSK